MAKHLKRLTITWSTRALLVMICMTFLLLWFEFYSKDTTGEWLPMEYVYGWFAVFVVEVGAMATLKVNKNKAAEPHSNKFLEQMGLYGNASIASVIEAETTNDLPNGVDQNGEIS